MEGKHGNIIGGFLACSRVTFEVRMRTSQSGQSIKGIIVHPKTNARTTPPYHVQTAVAATVTTMPHMASQLFELSPVYQLAKEKWVYLYFQLKHFLTILEELHPW